MTPAQLAAAVKEANKCEDANSDVLPYVYANEPTEVKIDDNPAADDNCLQCIMSKGHFCATNVVKGKGKCVARVQKRDCKKGKRMVDETVPDLDKTKTVKVEKKSFEFKKLKDEWADGKCSDGSKPITAIGMCGNRQFTFKNTNPQEFNDYKKARLAEFNGDTAWDKAVKVNDKYAIKRGATWHGSEQCVKEIKIDAKVSR